MKRFLLGLTLLSFYACGNAGNDAVNEEADIVVESQPITVYGDSIETEGALQPDEFLTRMEGKDSLEVTMEGVINETCRMKGCWMTINIGEGEEMRVRFKDYAFFVPKEGVDGKTAVIQGVAFRDTVSVDELRHYAEDAGKSQDEIAAITEPKVSVNFEARGVVIRD